MNRQELNSELAATCKKYRGELELQERLEMCLVALHRAAARAPSDFAQHVQFLDDADIATRIKARAVSINKMSPPADWDRPDGPVDVSDADLAKTLFVEIRAIDKSLYELRDKAIKADDPCVEFLVRGTQSFLLPLPAIPTSKKTFARSALSYHRILPTEVDGVAIKLYPGPELGRVVAGSRAVAGALFGDFDLRIDPPGGLGPFRVDGVDCLQQIEQIESHIATLMDGEQQLVVVWPELTVPPEVRESILAKLRSWPFARGLTRPTLVVPGSWHENDGPDTVNRCRIHDGFGTFLLQYDKRKMFSLTGRQENIKSGREIPIMIIGDRLISFATCLDFCEGMYDRAYPKLAVDLFVVPSYGGQATIEAHGAAASDAYLKHGTSTFVVQQGTSDEPAEGGGYIMMRRGAQTGGDDRARNGLSFRTF